MRKALLLAAVLAAGALFALERVDLNGLWDFRFERNKSLEDVARTSAFEANEKMTVPVTAGRRSA